MQRVVSSNYTHVGSRNPRDHCVLTTENNDCVKDCCTCSASMPHPAARLEGSIANMLYGSQRQIPVRRFLRLYIFSIQALCS